MKRPSNSGDDEENRFPLAADELFSSSPARRIGETIIQFPGPAASAGDHEGAGVSSASASSPFVSLGSVTHAVVLRLRGGFPRISMPARPGEEEEEQAAPADQSAWERD